MPSFMAASRSSFAPFDDGNLLGGQGVGLVDVAVSTLCYLWSNVNDWQFV